MREPPPGSDLDAVPDPTVTFVGTDRRDDDPTALTPLSDALRDDAEQLRASVREAAPARVPRRWDADTGAWIDVNGPLAPDPSGVDGSRPPSPPPPSIRFEFPEDLSGEIPGGPTRDSTRAPRSILGRLLGWLRGE